ncbi:hypothetical protein ABFA07_019388 [Porites harrisoni]
MLDVILYAVGTLLLVCVAFVFIFAVFLANKRRQFSHIPSPPMASFFKGHADEITEMRHKGFPTDHKFLEWHIEYGKVLLVWFWHVPLLLVAGSEMVKEILIVKNLPKDPQSYEILSYLYGQRYLGSGLVTNLDNESWKTRRGIMNPAFHRKSLKDLMSSFNSTADLLLDHLSTMADGKTQICMVDEFARAALDVICKVAFGMEIDVISGKDTKFTDAVSLSFHGVEEATFDLFHKFKVFQFPFQRRVVSSVKFLRETARKVIEVRKSAMKRGEQVPDDILQRIIEQEKIPGVGIEEMLDDFVTFFIAGHETTSNMLAFCVLDLADHPDILDSLVGEIFDVLGDKKHVAFDDLAKLHQHGLVLKETLRRHPTATGTLRRTNKDMEIGGYKIPANVSVMTSTYVSSHFPEYWNKPEEYNPYRFEDEELLKRSHYNYFPFSLGPRNCIGKNFAQIEAKVLLSRFLQTFKFSLVPGQSRDVLERVTLRPKDGVMCTLTKRN